MKTREISLVLSLSASLLMAGLAMTAHGAEAEQQFQFRRTAPAALGNGCSIGGTTDRAYRAATPSQRRVMDGARSNLDSSTRQFAQDRQAGVAAPLEITIPVVVHVVHDNGPENISDARIIAAISQMTEDFHAYPFAGNVDGYGNLQANVGFTFKLAKLDPQGRPTSGITRTRSTTTYDGTEGPLQSTINWPREKYLNIWVVYSSDGSNGSAYSNYPSTVADGTGVEYWDGIVVSYWAVGPSAVSGYEKILTHEAGHWANLIHTWGDTYNNGDSRACSDPVGDRVSDTPLTSGNTGCSTSQTCGYRDNTENFMDYGSCTTMFTIGQSDRMQAAMRSSVARRSNVWTQANLIATGLASGNPPATVTLENGVPKTGLSAAAGSDLNFTLDVPAGATNLRFAMSGGTGDADMHVRFGSAPTLTTYDCRPYAGGNNETCNISPAQAGRYYVMLNAFSAFSGVTLTGSYTGGSGNTPPVANFSFTTSGLTASFTDSSTDANGSIASRSWNFGDGTTSTAANPTKTYAAAGTYNVTLTATDNQGATNSVAKSVTVSTTTPPPTLPECTASDSRQLGKNCARSNRSQTAGNYDYLYISLPAGVPQLKITVSGGTGNANLFVSRTSWATSSNYQYSSTNAGNNETLIIPSPPSGYMYISLHAASSFSGVKITTEY